MLIRKHIVFLCAVNLLNFIVLPNLRKYVERLFKSGDMYVLYVFYLNIIIY
jgi:hypothetical protein